MLYGVTTKGQNPGEVQLSGVHFAFRLTAPYCAGHEGRCLGGPSAFFNSEPGGVIE